MEIPSSHKTTNEEGPDVIKAGFVTASFAPVKNKRSYYAVLCERALELHDKEKDFKKRKPARFFIDLSVTFNVHNDHYDPKMKQCMCWMGSEDTFCLKGESQAATTEWFNAIFQAVRISRTLTLCRPVTIDEFFTYAWDIEVVVQPKFKKTFYEEEKLPNIVDTGHLSAGPKRLCFYPHTMFFCNRGIEATTTNVVTSNVPPFDKSQYYETQRSLCAHFGVHERFFLIKLGRAAPPGSCSVWVQCDNEDVALHIFRKVNQLIDWEAQKKKNFPNSGDVSNALNSIASYSRSSAHRDRSHTQPIQMRSHLHGHLEDTHSIDENETPIVVPIPSRPNPLLQYAPRDRRNILMERKATVASFEEDGTRLQTPQLAAVAHLRPRGSLGNPTTIELLERKLCSPSTSSTHVGRKSSGASLSARANTMGSPAKSMVNNNANPTWSVFPAQQRRSSNASQSIVEEPGDYQVMFAPPQKPPESQPPKQMTEEDKNEDSGGTIRPETSETLTPEMRKTLNLTDKKDSDTDERSSIGANSGLSMPSSAENEEAYTQMDMTAWEGVNSLKVNVTQCGSVDRLDDAKYVSDSSDSCYSSMAANSSMNTSITGNTQRAYSFGGRQQLKHVVTTITEQGMEVGDPRVATLGTLQPPLDDPRKRSYSLGSKNFITRPFQHIARKLVNQQGRQQRHSQTSASGVSLASSGGSSFGPSSSSSNHLASSDQQDESRNRSGSFGSGRSTPYTKRVVDDVDDHLVEMEFPVRSCSSSMASIDSPSSRSRTSSFGYSSRKDDFFTGPSLIRLEELQNQVKEKLREEALHQEIASTKSAVEPSPAPPPPIQHPVYLGENYSNLGFGTIEESDSESSRRGSRQSLNVVNDKNSTPKKPSDYDDDYAPMDLSLPSTSRSIPAVQSPLVMRNHSNKHRNSPAASPKTTQPDSTRIDRSASSPVRDVLVPPTGVPKRCSIPAMRSDSKDDSSLNYASLQINDDAVMPASLPKEPSLLSSPSNRTRSQSGIIFSNDKQDDYATVKPL